MKIIIDIPDKIYNDLRARREANVADINTVFCAISGGVVLPTDYNNKFDAAIRAHEHINYERGVADGYAEAIEEKPQGKWISGKDSCSYLWFCSNCNATIRKSDFIPNNFCPNCGAKMINEETPTLET